MIELAENMILATTEEIPKEAPSKISLLRFKFKHKGKRKIAEVLFVGPGKGAVKVTDVDSGETEKLSWDEFLEKYAENYALIDYEQPLEEFDLLDYDDLVSIITEKYGELDIM